MISRRQFAVLFVAVGAVSALLVGVITLGETRAFDRPETGQAPDPTVTPGADSASRTTNHSTEPTLYRVTATSESALNRSQLNRYGEVGTQAGRHIEVALTRANATRVANLSWIESIQPVQRPVADDKSSNTYDASQASTQQTTSIAGDSVKVGVIDDGFDTSNPVISDQIGAIDSFRESPGDVSHGTNVAETVARIAPNSSLYLAAVESGTDNEAAIRYLIDQDVDIIVMSLSWYTLDDNGNHFLTDEVNQAREQGVLFVNSAGNYAQQHWEGEFRSPDGDQFHDWESSDERNCVPNCQEEFSGEIDIVLHWENDGDGSEYRIILYDPVAKETIARSTSGAGHRAILSTDVDRRPVDLIVEHVNGPADDRIEVLATETSLQYTVAASSLSPPADVPSVLSVAAYQSDNERIAPYSSQGPTDTGYQGVDLTGYTDLQLSEGEFDGTSAAAPYVAGVAALMQDASSDELTPDELETALENTTIDIHTAGPDTVSGAGLINATAAVAAVRPDNDRFEQNDEPGTATPIQPGTYTDLQIVREDRDYFAVEVTANTSLTATAAFDHQQGDLELGIIGSNGDILAAGTSVTDNETARINRSTAGTYYLVVLGATNDTVASYSLTVDIEQQATTEAASVQVADQTTTGSTVSVADATLPDGGFIAIHATGENGSVGPVIGSSQYLPPGPHENIGVQLDTTLNESQTVIAIPHRDTNENQVYEFPEADAPYTDSDQVIIDSAFITVESASESGLQLTAPDQTATSGDTVTVTYTVENVGTAEEASLLIEPTETPDGVSVVSVEASAASTIQDRTAFFTELASGGSYQLSVTYRLSDGLNQGTYSLGARTEGNSGASDTTVVTLNVTTSIVPAYDEDGSGTIDNRELLDALADYPDEVSATDLLELLAVYDADA